MIRLLTGLYRAFFRSAGYLLYTFVVLLFFLWYLFPVQKAVDWLEWKAGTLTPGWIWKVDGLGLRLPLLIHADYLRITGPRKGERLILEAVDLRLLHFSPREQRVRLGWRADLASGTVQGIAHLSADGDGQLAGSLTGLALEKLEFLHLWLKRALSGQLQGSFNYTGPFAKPQKAAVQLSLLATEGKFALQEPVLGMREFSYGRLEVQCSGSGTLQCPTVTMDGRQLQGSCKGEVILAANFPQSRLRCDGSIVPRPELLSGMGSGPEVELIRSSVRGGALSFVLSGTVDAPGISFSQRAQENAAQGNKLPEEKP